MNGNNFDSYEVDCLTEIVEEYRRAAQKFPDFASGHEGYAVILEELDELWQAIKKNEPRENWRQEAVQVGAMALRFLVDLCDRRRVKAVKPQQKILTCPKGCEGCRKACLYGGATAIPDESKNISLYGCNSFGQGLKELEKAIRENRLSDFLAGPGPGSDTFRGRGQAPGPGGGHRVPA